MPLPARSTLNRYARIGEPKKRDGDDRQHRRNVAMLPCLATGRPGPSDPHHLMRTGDPAARGTGLKSPDKHLIPLSRRVHDLVTPQGDDVAWLMKHYGIDARGMAATLWEKRGDLQAMHRIVVRDLQRRGITYYGEDPEPRR